MHKFLFVFIGLVLISRGACFGQSPQINVDSLTTAYKQYPKADTTKLKMLFDLISKLQKTSASNAHPYADEAIILAEKIDKPFFIAESYFVKACVFISNGNHLEGTEWLNKALPIFSKLQKNDEIGDVYERFGAIGSSKLDYNSAKSNYEKAIDYYIKSKNVKSQYEVKSQLASVHGQMGDHNKSIRVQDEMISYFKKNNLKESMARVLGAKARSHYLIGEKSVAIELLLKSLSINEEIGNIRAQLFNLQNLATLFQFESNPEKALEYAQKGLKLNEQLQNLRIEGALKHTAGDSYRKLSDLKAATLCYQNALKIFEELNMKTAIIEINGALSLIFSESKQYTNLYKTSVNLIKIYEENQSYSLLPSYFSQLGAMLLTMPDSSLLNVSILPQNRYTESLHYLEKGLKMAQEQNDLTAQCTLYKDISFNYEYQKKYAEAHEACKMYVTLKDSISSDEVQKKITRSEIQYEYDKKELALKYEKQLTDEQLGNQLLLTTQQKQALTLKEQALTLSNQEKDLSHLAFLKEQAEKQEKEQELALSTEREKTKEQDLALKNLELTAQQKQNLYLGAFIFFLLCGLGALVYFYQTMRKQKNIIAQQNQLNEHTISILSHDIKEPLLGVKLLLKKLYVNDPFLSQASLSLENQINSVNGVLNNLLNMKKLSMTDHSKNPTSEVQDVVQSVVKQMQQAIQEKNITVQNLLPADFTLPIANEKLQVVVHNILSNAIKYSHPDQSIKIYKEGNGFCIQDFGVGLSDVQTVKMMTDVKNSKPGTTQEQGHGMGLYLVGMLLQSEQVKVIFESPEIGGTIVKIMS